MNYLFIFHGIENPTDMYKNLLRSSNSIIVHSLSWNLVQNLEFTFNVPASFAFRGYFDSLTATEYFIAVATQFIVIAIDININYHDF